MYQKANPNPEGVELNKRDELTCSKKNRGYVDAPQLPRALILLVLTKPEGLNIINA